MKLMRTQIIGVLLCGLLGGCAAPQAAPSLPEGAGSPVFLPAGIPRADTPTSAAAPTNTASSTHSPSITPTTDPARETQARSYVFPVQPQAGADFSAGGHTYPATDIFALEGTNFVAVTGGVVDFVSLSDVWDPATNDPAVAGGLCVAIIGDDGVRYYGSHLSAIARGIRQGVHVEAGQLLGRVGQSGNAANTPPHLHFGISHPTYPEDWKTRRGELDPYPYLVAWSRGENVTPQFPTAPPS
jgi:murein DD-endopeptidase MepM/ murein hydrolase activator NlpD